MGLAVTRRKLIRYVSFAFSGYSAGIKAKLNLPVLPFTPVAIANFNSLGRSGGITLQNRIMTFGLGAEYAPLSLGVVTLYLGVDVAANMFSSNATDAHGIMRFGGGAGVGAQVNLPGFPVALDVEAKYRFNNLVGTLDTEVGRNTLQLGVQLLFRVF
jgi:hypothetical protein